MRLPWSSGASRRAEQRARWVAAPRAAGSVGVPVVALSVLVRADDGEVRVQLDLDLAAVVEVHLDLVAVLLVLDLAVDDLAAAGLGERGLAGPLQIRAADRDVGDVGDVGAARVGRAGDPRSGHPGDDGGGSRPDDDLHSAVHGGLLAERVDTRADKGSPPC